MIYLPLPILIAFFLMAGFAFFVIGLRFGVSIGKEQVTGHISHYRKSKTVKQEAKEELETDFKKN